ncbi:MAG TPA: hypothetical protein VF168_06530 [Trueperaceae bacterium]
MNSRCILPKATSTRSSQRAPRAGAALLLAVPGAAALLAVPGAALLLAVGGAAAESRRLVPLVRTLTATIHPAARSSLRDLLDGERFA